jgi:hypothetical protein
MNLTQLKMWEAEISDGIWKSISGIKAKAIQTCTCSCSNQHLETLMAESKLGGIWEASYHS